MVATLTVAPYPFTEVTLRENLASNPSVETDTAGWSRFAGSGGAASISRPGPYTSGEHAPLGYVSAYFLRLTWTTGSTGPGGFFYSGTPVAAGQTYSAAVYVRCSKSQRVRVGIDWLDAGSALVASTDGPATVLPSGGAWHRITVEGAVAPAGAVTARVTVYSITGSGYSNWAVGNTLDVDNLIIERSATAGDYFDGDTSARTLTPGTRFFWLGDGTPHKWPSRMSVRNPAAEAQQVSVDLITRWEDWVEDTSVWHQVVGSDRFLPSVAPWTPRFVRFEVWCKTETDAQAARAVLTARPQIATMLRSDEHPAIEMYLMATRVGLTAERAGRWIVPVEGREWARP